MGKFTLSNFNWSHKLFKKSVEIKKKDTSKYFNVLNFWDILKSLDLSNVNLGKGTKLKCGGDSHSWKKINQIQVWKLFQEQTYEIRKQFFEKVPKNNNERWNDNIP